jgi:hypothetical protein
MIQDASEGPRTRDPAERTEPIEGERRPPLPRGQREALLLAVQRELIAVRQERPRPGWGDADGFQGLALERDEGVNGVGR